ncbi:MAG TPA: hypothetical protein VIB11_04175 [Pedococcus sp.]|uniref:hypothetical protein n=1 Tax=Pedococcus sp. TaxID=2860345 RepID=UPI002F94AECF
MRWPRGARQASDTSTASEDPTARRYRYLLHTAPREDLEAAHVAALGQMAEEDRRTVLQAVRDQLVVGQHVSEEDTSQIAHLMVLGEQRRPGDVLAALPRPVLVTLAQRVIGTAPAERNLDGYAQWDGRDPVVDESRWDHGGFTKDERWRRPPLSHTSGFSQGPAHGGGGE